MVERNCQYCGTPCVEGVGMPYQEVHWVCSKECRDAMDDPVSWTSEQRAIWFEQEYRRVSKQETDARAALAKLLKCPATWGYILPEIVKRIQ